MRKDWSLTQESFDRLLAWLGPGREEAGREYERIRRSLIKIFTCRGCREPEDLADETMNRVADKLPQIENDYSGDPAPYFFGVANKVYLESLRRRPAPSPPPPPAPSEEEEREYECLQRCVARLPPDHRDLVLQYYEEEKRSKIDNRKRLAERLGMSLSALRTRAHRIRVGLQKCLEECLCGGAAA